MVWFMDRDLFRCKTFANVAVIRRKLLAGMVQKHVLLTVPRTKIVVEPPPVVQSLCPSTPTCRNKDSEEPFV